MSYSVTNRCAIRMSPASEHITAQIVWKDLANASLSKIERGESCGRVLSCATNDTALLPGPNPSTPRRFACMRLFSMVPPMATPKACPKERKNRTSVADIATFVCGTDAWIASAIEGKSRPIPSPETAWRNIHAAMLVFTSSLIKSPQPSVVRNHPHQSAQRYLPVSPTTTPTAIAHGTTVKVCGNAATPEMVGLYSFTAWKYSGM